MTYHLLDDPPLKKEESGFFCNSPRLNEGCAWSGWRLAHQCYNILHRHNAPPLNFVLCVCALRSVRQWALSALVLNMAPLFLGTRPSRNQLYVSAAVLARALWQRRRCELCGLLALIYAHCNFSVSFQLIFFAPARPPTRRKLLQKAWEREKWQLLANWFCRRGRANGAISEDWSDFYWFAALTFY